MMHTEELRNGVRLTYPLRLDIKEILASIQQLAFITDLQDKGSTNPDLARLIGGKTLKYFREGGSSQASNDSSTGPGCGLT